MYLWGSLLCILFYGSLCMGLNYPSSQWPYSVKAPIKTRSITTSKAETGTSGGAQASATATASAAFYTAVNSYEIDYRTMLIYPPLPSCKFLPPVCGLKIPACDPNTYYRRFDGSCNNLQNPSWGVPNSTYTRMLPPEYADGVRSPRKAHDNTFLPNARKIRTTLFPIGQTVNNIWNINFLMWGQFMAHDMSLLRSPDHVFPCCTADGQYIHGNKETFCYPIKVPADDLTMGKAGIRCMNFSRTFTDRDMVNFDNNKPASQINVVTDYMDLSNVYGLNKEMCDGLRSFKKGQLKTEIRNNHVFLPRETNEKTFCRCNLANEHTCYKTGDSRANQNPQLTILQTLFMRQHNKIAADLAKINPKWCDETVFQEARRIMIAIYQQISYYEWLTIALGRENLLNNNIIFNTTGYHNDYDPIVNPGVSNEHANSAYRYFHTNIVGIINLLNEKREITGNITLSDWFNRPTILESRPSNMEQLTLGMVTQNIEEFDNRFVMDIADKLFACGKKYGIDLRATDIQRDRDHGLAYYHKYKEALGFKAAKSFDDFTEFISQDNVNILKTIYNDYRDIDLSVGGSLEKHALGAQAGPTFQGIMNDQFLRTRQGDRFFFEHKESGFTEAQLAEIKKMTVARMYCDCGDGITNIHKHAFTLTFPFNPIVQCSTIPQMDLTLWKVSA